MSVILTRFVINYDQQNMKKQIKYGPTTGEVANKSLEENKMLQDEVIFLNAVINHAGEPIFVKDEQSKIILANDSFCKAFRLHREEVIGKTLAEHVPKNEREHFLNIDKQVLTTGKKSVVEESLTINGSQARTIVTTKTRYTDSNGKHFLIGVISDITDRKSLENQLREKANTDYLTGLNTRGHFMDLANQELNRLGRYNHPVSLIVMDIDLFKKINDLFGHQAGDMVIIRLAEVSKGILRKVDIMGRIGGEEFAILLPETSEDKAIEVAERLRKTIQNMQVDLEGNHLPIKFTVSIGLTSLLSNDKSLESLLSLADKALYQAKNSGRNRVCTLSEL
jgi:diguanylate cyclase (GGDEF)-like protein/PAS domain S-box-containing protein